MAIKNDNNEENIINLKNEIIHKLINERIKLKLSQRDLAEKTGIHQSAIARIETKGAFPRIETLFIIANVLGLELKFVNKK